ncbi:hypothetical protein V8D89_000409 [Ganoderma adspersum]
MSQGQSVVFNPESTGTEVVTAIMEQTMGFDPGPTTTKASSSQSLESSSTPHPGVTISRGSSPTSTSALSTGHSRVSSGAIAGIAVGMCVAASCLMLALLCYLKRRKRRLISIRVDPFTDHRHLRAKSPLESHTSTRTSSYKSSAGRPADGDRSVLWIRADAQTQPDASLVARVSSSASDGAVQPPQPRRASSNGVVMAEKVLREMRNRTWDRDRAVAPPSPPRGASTDARESNRCRVEIPVSSRTPRNSDRTAAPSDSGASTDDSESPIVGTPVPPPIYIVERRRSQRYEVDGGVRLAGGRVGEVLVDDLVQGSTADGSTLPPPYSSHFGGR